jgi:hypothetical protein
MVQNIPSFSYNAERIVTEAAVIPTSVVIQNCTCGSGELHETPVDSIPQMTYSGGFATFEISCLMKTETLLS